MGALLPDGRGETTSSPRSLIVNPWAGSMEGSGELDTAQCVLVFLSS